MKFQKILIAGQEGMVGSSVLRHLKKENYKILNCRRKDLDFLSQSSVNKWFKKYKPDIVINAAGRVGGILDNLAYQPDYIYENTMIGFNLIHSSLINDVKKFINLGSVSNYPRKTKIPIKESYLLTSPLEKTNEAYAISKISTIKFCEYIKTNFKKDFISLIPANLYGTGDNFDLKRSHVIPALIKKFHKAKIQKKRNVEVWGSGKSMREFLNVEDLAAAIVFCIKKKIRHNYLNVGSADYLSIKELSYLIKEIVEFKGKIQFNRKYPDGTLKRKLDTKLFQKLGWKNKIFLKKGLVSYYEEFKKNL
ncbi:NAD-dependent epimerase/dehydratase family protein [Candidatus Pelagibacter sp.]|nr:NAD-dependent epimerase/dehydratase family protein [Candidatus Pelagibacter sp.]